MKKYPKKLNIYVNQIPHIIKICAESSSVFSAFILRSMLFWAQQSMFDGSPKRFVKYIWKSTRPSMGPPPIRPLPPMEACPLWQVENQKRLMFFKSQAVLYGAYKNKA